MKLSARHGIAVLAALCCVCASLAAANPDTATVSAPQCAPLDCASIGGFTPAFVEPLLLGPDYPDYTVPQNPLNQRPDDGRCSYDANGRPLKCKPAAGSIAVLPDNRVLYFNALEGTERVEYSIFFEAGHAIQDDQTRVLSLAGSTATWTLPTPNDAGANPDGATPSTLLPPGTIDTEAGSNNDGALFCADLNELPDGRVLAAGGTDYYQEPGVEQPFPIGVSELEGLKNSRLYDPRTNHWSKTGDMNYGRWYPSLVSLPNGDEFVASGVTKLVKPVYPDNVQQSGRNVVQTETYNACTGTWADNGALAQRSLPLFPRLHLLPNGQVYYNAAGQAFNPFGQAYDQALWNFTAIYDPPTKTWSDLAYAGLPPAAVPADPLATAGQAVGAGFRGSTFSIMLPLKPGADGQYRKAEFLTAGGTLGLVAATNPGSGQPVAFSRIDTVTIGANNAASYSSRATGSLNTARWYGTGVLLPTGEVMVFSGADRDEVQAPGMGHPILQTERFDPVAEKWSTMAMQGHPRTYHNTALLLPDGRVLVGGHAPINTAYAWSVTLPGFSPNDGRDPSFEIYSPPYMFGPRPTILGDVGTLHAGDQFTVTTHESLAVKSVVLVRRTTLTHLVDGDQRSIVLPIVSRDGSALHVQMPSQKAVVPPGSYMLFITAPGPNGLAPSVSVPVTVVDESRPC